MSTLSYKLEYVFDDNNPSDASVFIQLRDDPPAYRSQIGKEDYAELAEDRKSEFITGIFTIPGIVEVSSTAYRVWVMKSPTYTWSEVNTALLAYLQSAFGASGLTPLPGSAEIDGSGLPLKAVKNRRAT